MTERAEQFTRENTPELTDEDRARLNVRYAEALLRSINSVTRTPEQTLDLGFFDRLAEVVRQDFETQRKIAQAFTTYQAKGNREDLA